MKMTNVLVLAMVVVMSSLQFAWGSFESHAALHFEAIASKSKLMKGKSLAKIKPCGTGLEGTGTFSVEATKPDCINAVFKLTDVTNLPVTAMVPIWLAEKLGEESTNDTPFIRRFAIVLSTGASLVRQLLESQLFASFTTTWGEFEGMLFAPSSLLTLKYVKGTVLKMMAKDIIAKIIELVSSPCDLIPDVGISFIGSVNFQLSKWCRFGVASLLKRLLNALIAKVAPLIKGVAAKKTELQCFQLDKLVNLLVGRIDKEYIAFNGASNDLEKILKPGDCMVNIDEPPKKEAGKPECCNVCKPPPKFRFNKMKENKDPGINALMRTQLPSWLLKGEIIKYGLMSLLESLMDVAFDGVQEQIKKFISWTNKFVGAAKPLPGDKK